MGYEAAIEISRAIKEIDEGRWVIPAFQRRLVWPREKVQLLFDSLMRDYPIGSMLLWRLGADAANEYPFYRFVQHFHAHNRNKGGLAAVKGREDVRAVLDGQQRLTALYVGLCGTHTAQPWYGRVKFADSWPPAVLHLRIRDDKHAKPEADDRVDDEAELEEFDFRFLTDDQVKAAAPGTWFPVPDVMAMQAPGAVRAWFARNNLSQEPEAYDRISNLRRVVWDRPVISFYLEEDQRQHKAVTVFQRINRQGSPLTMAQIVFSTVVEEWPAAHEKVDHLVAAMNTQGRPSSFSFDRDLVFKASLVLADVSTLRLDIDTFSKDTVQRLRDQWSGISASLLDAAKLIGQEFAYGSERLSSKFAIIPVAYYLHAIGGSKRLDAGTKKLIQRWLAEMLARRVFSRRRDARLSAMRMTLRERSGNGFPAAALSRSIGLLPLADEDFDQLLDTSYGDNAFPLLSLLFPSFQFDKQLDVDHIHPKKIARGRNDLLALGMSSADADFFAANVDRLANLQLLDATKNRIDKRAKPFATYLSEVFPAQEARERELRDNAIPRDLTRTVDFRRFYEERRAALRELLVEVLRPEVETS